MYAYKDATGFPYQIIKYNTLIDNSHKKSGPFSKNLDYCSFNYLKTDQDCLIANIFAAYDNERGDKLYQSLNYLSSYLVNKKPEVFPLLVQTQIISLLIGLSSPESTFECKNTAYLCLYNILALYSETTPLLLQNGILNVFYSHIYNNEFNKKSNLNIDGIVNLLIDEPKLIHQVMSQFPMSIFVGNPPFDNILSMFLKINKDIFESINRLFIIYLENGVSMTEIDLMIKFYCACLKKADKIADSFSYLRKPTLEGINNCLIMCRLKNNQYSLISEIDFINILEYINEDYKKTLLHDKKQAEIFLNGISLCFDIFSKLVEYRLSSLNYDFRDILSFCTLEENDRFCHFNDNAGISAFELVATILLNCEEDTYYSFLYGSNFKFIKILCDAITKGSYYIIYPAAVSLNQIIQGCNDPIINDQFIDEYVFEALLKMMIIDNKKIQIKTIKSIRIIFNRSERNADCPEKNFSQTKHKDINECISAFDSNYGCDIFANCMNSTDNEEISKNCYCFLTHYFPLII